MDSISGFGDSFLFGVDLQYIYYSTWPALIANQLGKSYNCYAVSGCGNSIISQNVIEHSTPDSLTIINWTWIDRFDYVLDEEWCTVRPESDGKIADFYLRHLQSDLLNKYESLKTIYATHQYLKNNNIKFISTYMDRLFLDQEWHYPKYVRNLQESLKNDFHTFDGQTFLEWSRANKFKESKTWHPLEEAHIAAANYWKETYRLMIG